MREIKFRAWFPKRKEMIEPDFITSNGIAVQSDPGEGMSTYDGERWGSVESTTLILMQYTGLKDKNGREIFEGDIVRKFNDDLKEVCFFDDLGYDQSLGKASGFYVDHELEYYDGGPSTWEVIGNIYENPELLT
jgi:uncharacterized phage protein (TIGR01671 family)